MIPSQLTQRAHPLMARRAVRLTNAFPYVKHAGASGPAALLLLLKVLTGCESPRPRTSDTGHQELSAASAASSPNIKDDSVRFEGQGMRNTKAFYLSGGDYAIVTTVTPELGHGCGNLSSLVGIGDARVDFLAQSDVRKPFTDTNLVYSKQPGRYYMNMSSGCKWVVTVQRQR
jgi:hypothetical protein